MEKQTKVGVVAFGFGAPSDISANEEIARRLDATMEAHNAFGFTQQDVLCENQVLEMEYASNPKPTTLGLARASIEWARERELETLLIIAAKPHRWRCKRDLNTAAREAGNNMKIVVVGDINVTATDWFCKDSSQKRTRSWLQWWMRESILYIMPFWVYKRVAR